MKNNSLTLSERKVQIIVWTLLFCNPLMGMAVDLVSPSLPAIATDLHVLPSVAKSVISIYLLGYALGNFFTGFLTELWEDKNYCVLDFWALCWLVWRRWYFHQSRFC